MEKQSGVNIAPLSLPKGGGTSQGMGENIANAGPSGMSSMSIPLPLSSGRTYSPSLLLSYSSGAGNGAFGLGWQVGLLSISLRTQRGVPRYAGKDQFLSPAGELLVIALNTLGAADVQRRTQLQGVTLSSTHLVTTYQPRVIEDNSRLEYWQPSSEGEEKPFWVIYSPDGNIHFLGKTKQARIYCAENTNQIAQWLIEETITPTGEHVYYQYKAENLANCDEQEQSLSCATEGAQRYLWQVSYGNIQAAQTPFILRDTPIQENSWLFHAIFDYGERSIIDIDKPDYHEQSLWLCRPDCFSRFEYGFEIRTRRLCQQVLMFHRVDLLSGATASEQPPELVARVVFEYDFQPTLTTLVAVKQIGHEIGEEIVTRAPLEFDYQHQERPKTNQWEAFTALQYFNSQQSYQLVDLFGEGISGILYQSPEAWWYRSPERDATIGENAVSYSEPTALVQTPSLKQNAVLMDFTGNGLLDWVIAQPGLEGYYSQQPDNRWTQFIPISAFPTEYFHSSSQLIDLTGNGIIDLVLIGPKSVRIYPNNREGFSASELTIQPEGVVLPIANAETLVGFSDLLGSGQQHLVAINAEGVTCWANLGYGKFSPPRTLDGFSLPKALFNPNFIYLVDTDGSGYVDLIYVQPTQLLVYSNEAGNCFSEPYVIALPTGVQFDNTCLLQAADVTGMGVVSLILTVPHQAPYHWKLDFSSEKAWLLNTINNNMGAETSLRYRSSAQFWLDEKAKLQKMGLPVVSHLPFPIHVLWQTQSVDEITQNCLSSSIRYEQGVWDGVEREFRGFGYLEMLDTDERAQGNAPERTAPTLTKSWFLTGNQTVDQQQYHYFWKGDPHAFDHLYPRYSQWVDDKDISLDTFPSGSEYWLTRSLKGMPLRTEVFGLDGSDKQHIPYSIVEFRFQSRLLPSISAQYVTQVSQIEERTYTYERIIPDPQCAQSIVVEQDLYGAALKEVTIAYPRRAKSASDPYPTTLPTTTVGSSYDEQQTILRLVIKQSRWHQLISSDTYVLGIADCQRSDAFEFVDSEVPKEGITLETLIANNGLLGKHRASAYLGQQRIVYTDGKREFVEPVFPVLVAYTETAVLDEQALKAFDGHIGKEELLQYLHKGGYTQAPQLLGQSTELVWCARQGYTDYGDAKQFWRPLATRTTLLTGKTHYRWSQHYCVITAMEDAAGMTTYAQYDYRFMTPIQIQDINNNQSHAALDALGRVTSTRFWGTENGLPCGYSPPSDKPFKAPLTVEDILSLPKGTPVSQAIVYCDDSWMYRIDKPNDLPHDFKITIGNKIGSLALRRLRRSCALKQKPFVASTTGMRIPPHFCTITTDRYDNDPEQQLRQQVVFFDGFGRTLQTSVRHEAGNAYVRDDSGALQCDPQGQLIERFTPTRWAITGKTEYNNKGLAVRTYQPYFLDSWRYVSDTSSRSDLYADTVYYDPLGRASQVLTAKNYLRRTQIFPWFTVEEDENDTLEG
ncbi:SpvB/TcaC N-terminal domain-containing protein [Providencia vermicola]|uniref:SpvB/TcaC N-terminal domain-containing protein n=1 Tax=Providencia vermicola TaxID=333965 RepID=UPI003D2A3415